MKKEYDLGLVVGPRGAPGANGKSAYQLAVEGGYTGTEAEFNAVLTAAPRHIADKGNPHGVTAEQVGARPSTWTPSWSEVSGRPATFPAAGHTHPWGDVTEKPGAYPPSAHSHAQEDVTGLAAALAGKAAKSTQVSATIGVAWSGSAGNWTQTLSIAGATATNVVEVFLAKGATDAQDKAYTALQLRDGGQAAGYVTLKARGTKNTIAVPITVIVRRDL